MPLFTFSILGMNLFGCKFCKSTDNRLSNAIEPHCPRKNFDSLLWATITVFQVRINFRLRYLFKNLFIGFDSRRLAWRTLQWNEKYKSMGCFIFYSINDLWQLCFI